MTWLEEFKAFAMRGNVVDMAVGVIIGGAFGKITNSLVTDILTPPLGLLTGGINFKSLKLTLSTPAMVGMPNFDPVTISYGQFLQSSVDFVLVAFAMFVVIKAMNHLRRSQRAEEAAAADVPTPVSPDVEVLMEIRDLLRNQQPTAMAAGRLN
jgi:large conductance mechanosensitive channel